MVMNPPATVGMALEHVDTPTLIIDLDAFERNLKRLADAAARLGVRLRPHAKTHKSAAIALQQMALGAVGVCCQKVSEAEALIYGGVGNVLVSNQVVGANKLARLAALAHQAWVGVCVDNADNVTDVSRAAQNAGVTLDTLVEIDSGAGRCGVKPGEQALALAQRIADSPNLRFGGLQSYHGKAQHIRDFSERREAIRPAVVQTQLTMELLAKHGLRCDIVGGAGTGTYAFEGASGVYNELQAGSYVFMDADYARNLKQDGGFFDEFEHSLFVYATVMSKTASDWVVIDAGLKSHSVDSGMPAVHDMPGVTYSNPSDEHGKLNLGGAYHNSVKLGDKIKLIPGHCDPTVNLYDWYVGVRNGRVETLWPVSARGAVY
ncbi:MAG: DSD1 family PLP-dependent enzyme [Gammaproteobacteria bacterium]